jgi:hypothetical protein
MLFAVFCPLRTPVLSDRSSHNWARWRGLGSLMVLSAYLRFNRTVTYAESKRKFKKNPILVIIDQKFCHKVSPSEKSSFES